jgi:two-component system CheB/CheR fusion protein
VAPRVVKPPPAQLPEDALYKVFIMLRSAFGVDFTYYKHTTIRRRIMRRMVLHKIEGLDKYIKFLQNNPAELNALYQDILITVTNFFRDAEEFEALKENVFPNIVKNRAPDAPIRVWTPGCSTGEEAYSIAISWVEFLKEAATSTPIQIFATDVNDKAIEKARAGVYPESITADVSPERLRRFFTKVDGGYQINKSIRDMCVFARQDVTKDPPFSKMDLISCRNVLIYLGPVLQKKVIPLFHYALSSPGFLLLGTSETVGSFSDLFTLADKKHKIYAKKATATRPAFDFVIGDYGVEKVNAGRGIGKPSEIEYGGFDIRKETDRIILNKYSPAGITINENLEILQFRGHTGAYLEPMPGVASLNLLKMVREDLAHDVRSAIQEAKKKGANVRREGLRFRRNGQIRLVNLDVMPVAPPHSKERFFLVLFEEAESSIRHALEQGESGKTISRKKKSAAEAKQEISSSEVARLRQELDDTRAYLQATIEEQDATNEELRSANEEIWSANEELQSTNEELETAKEELQSANEELPTVNEEMQNRNVELNQLNNDLNNLFGSINIPIVMLGQDMRIRRFTSPAEKALNLIPTDVGRPISDIKPNVEIPDLERLVLNVVETLEIVEQEVQDREGHWYSLRVRPYRTADNKIDGVVMALVDIDELKSNRRQLQETRDQLEAILGTAPPLLALDAELRVKRANWPFYHAFHLTPEETVDRPIYDLGDGEWNIPALRAMLAELTPERASIQNFELAQDFKHIGKKALLINACRVDGRKDISPAIFLVIQDLTDFKRA